jgi:hypothetical protein
VVAKGHNVIYCGGPASCEECAGVLPTPLIVGPNDSLVINIGSHATMQQIDNMRAQIAKHWGTDARVLIVCADEMAVIKGGATNG